MKELFKKFGALLLCGTLLFSAACGAKGDGADSSESSSSNSSWVEPEPDPVPQPPELSELIDDEHASASRGDKPEVPRFPEDEEWQQLVEKQRAIEAGESFTETFDGNYFTSRLSAVSDGARFEVIEGEDAIEGKSLRIETDGNYAGIRLTGTKFVAGGTYTIEMDYNVITPSDDFFFQFRDSTAGAASDIFATFGATAGKGKLTHTFTLGVYSGYYIMIMPRNNAGELVIDNIKVTREDSRPVASGLALDGEIAVGSTVTASYVYTDYEGDPEGESRIQWFVALNASGMNKTILENTGKTLTIGAELLGKYIGFQVIPMASTGENAEGVPVLYMASETVGGTNPDYGSRFELSEGESFTEDFEADVGEKKNLIFVPHGNTDNYIYREEARDSNVLRIKSDGTYLGTDFSGMSFSPRGIYRISFDYAFRTIPNTFYVQLRSSAGDSFYQIPTNVEAGTWQKAEGILEIGNAEDAFLMMFPDASPVEILIDNLTVERIPPDSSEIRGETFDIQSKRVDENFESVLNRQLYPEASGGTSFEITDEKGKSIDGNSVYAESSSSGEIAFMGATAKAGESFTVEFSYSVLEGAGISIGFTAEDGTAGEFVAVEDMGTGIKNAKLRVSTPESDKAYHLTVRFDGAIKVIFDNVKAEWLDMSSVGAYESFESEIPLYERNVFGGASEKIETLSSGNVLSVTTPADGGVKFKHKDTVSTGKKYAVTFTYHVTSSGAGNKLFIGFKEGERTVEFDAAQGASGRKTVYLTADTDGAAIFIGASSECSFTLDDIFIQRDTRGEGTLSEGTPSQTAPVYDESKKYYMDINNSSTIGFTNEARYQSELSSGYVLLVESKGAYGGIQIRSDSWDYNPSGTYKISLTYTVIANPTGSEMYVQLGSGVNKQFNGEDTAVGTQKSVEFELTASAAWDCVMIFGGGNANGFVFTIDDFSLSAVNK